MAKTALLSLRAYAKHRKDNGLSGGTLAAVQKAIKGGRIKTVKGKIDPARADRDWAGNTDPSMQRQAASAPSVETDHRDAPESDPADYQKSRAANEYWDAYNRQLKALRDEATLIEVAKVESRWAEIGALVKDEVMALPTRIVNRLPEEWRRQVSAIVNEEARRTLAAIHHEFRPDRAAA